MVEDEVIEGRPMLSALPICVGGSVPTAGEGCRKAHRRRGGVEQMITRLELAND
jgi:hypothetical protein